MKKIAALLVISGFVLAACTPEETAVEEGATEVVDAIEPKVDEEANGLEHQVGDVVEGESGTRRIVDQLENLNKTKESGPFKVTLLHAQLSQFQPTGEFVERFEGEDLVLVALRIEAANISDETHTLYPDQGFIETDEGEQVHAEMFLTDQVGGEFFGETTKTGDVFFLYDGQAEEVSSLRYTIEGPENHNAEDTGGDISFTIDFNS